VEGREGASSDTTHIRTRWYRADAQVLVALALEPAETAPDLAALSAALDHPARPLFIGRKPCLPTAPLRLGDIATAATPEDALRAALERLPPSRERDAAPRMEVDSRLLADPPADAETDRLVDRRDWRNQMHTGTRLVHRFRLGAAP
jgi:CRISPR system Cascade subunit CasD